MATITVYIFPKHIYLDQEWHSRRCLRISKDPFATRLVQLNEYFPYFPPEFMRLIVTDAPDDVVKEIRYNPMLTHGRR